MTPIRPCHFDHREKSYATVATDFSYRRNDSLVFVYPASQHHFESCLSKCHSGQMKLTSLLIAGKACLSVISTLNYMLGYTQWRYTL